MPLENLEDVRKVGKYPQCHTAHFLERMNLTGGIPLVEWVDLLGVLGNVTAGLMLVMEG